MFIEILKHEFKKQEENYRLFGILLFTDANPYVKKILRDQDYFLALNKVSGDHLGIFCTMLFEGKMIFPEHEFGRIGKIIPIWQEPEENEKLLKIFQINESRTLPCLVVFGFYKDEMYFHKYFIEGDSEESAFNFLKNALELITKVIRENKDKENLALFEKLRLQLKVAKFKLNFKKIVEIIDVYKGAFWI